MQDGVGAKDNGVKGILKYDPEIFIHPQPSFLHFLPRFPQYIEAQPQVRLRHNFDQQHSL
jgi:hypothetical protein